MINTENKLLVAFTGPSNSGKTSLIVKISNILQDREFKVCIIKHDPKDKATFDYKGKDSDKFSQTGANVAVVSPNRTTIFKKNTSSIDEICEMFGNFDYLLVEGLKTLDLPRIAIFRNKLDEKYFEFSKAIAHDDTIKNKDLPLHLDSLDLNNPEQIIDWININAKRVKK